MLTYQDKLRKKCRVVKALYNISYITIADTIGIAHSSFYNWLSGYYKLNSKHCRDLELYLNKIYNK